MDTESPKREGFRLLIEHCDGCFCANDPEYKHVWPLHDGYEYWKNKNGVGRGMWMFHRFRCNDPACPAILAVRSDILSGFLNA